VELVALLVSIIGLTLLVAGGLWLLWEAFTVSVWWGLGCLLVPFVSLIFLFVHWKEASRPFGLQVAAVAFMFLASLLGGNYTG
jgi:hypothetical protein